MKLTKCIIVLKILICWYLFALPMKNTNAQGAKIKPEMKLHGKKVISISSDEFKLRTLTVNSGTTVVWLNTSQKIMEFEFMGKQVVMACSVPVGFFVNEKGSFSSRKILPSSTASLCFIEKGDYDYEVTLRSFKDYGSGGSVRKTFKGKIIVK